GRLEAGCGLTNVKITGDTATSNQATTSKFSKGEKSISFVRVEGSWRILNDKDREKPVRTAKAPTFKTTAEAFAAEFAKDQEAASKKYDGKLVELEGLVEQASSSTVTVVGARVVKTVAPDGEVY